MTWGPTVSGLGSNLRRRGLATHIETFARFHVGFLASRWLAHWLLAGWLGGWQASWLVRISWLLIYVPSFVYDFHRFYGCPLFFFAFPQTWQQIKQGPTAPILKTRKQWAHIATWMKDSVFYFIFVGFPRSSSLAPQSILDLGSMMAAEPEQAMSMGPEDLLRSSSGVPQVLGNAVPGPSLAQVAGRRTMKIAWITYTFHDLTENVIK